jgi:hypothetical protein
MIQVINNFFAASNKESVITLEFEDTEENNRRVQQIRADLNGLSMDKDFRIYDTACK